VAPVGGGLAAVVDRGVVPGGGGALGRPGRRLRRPASAVTAAAADLDVHAVVERVGGVRDVPHGEDLVLAGGQAAQGVRDVRRRAGAALVEPLEQHAVDVVVPGAGAVRGGQPPLEGDGAGDLGHRPVPAVVVQEGPPGAAAAQARALGGLDALRLVLQAVAAGDPAGGAVVLAAGRGGDPAVGARRACRGHDNREGQCQREGEERGQQPRGTPPRRPGDVSGLSHVGAPPPSARAGPAGARSGTGGGDLPCAGPRR
jgi:hypothetical protein